MRKRREALRKGYESVSETLYETPRYVAHPSHPDKILNVVSGEEIHFLVKGRRDAFLQEFKQREGRDDVRRGRADFSIGRISRIAVLFFSLSIASSCFGQGSQNVYSVSENAIAIDAFSLNSARR